MVLTGPGKLFELKIDGYEFPDILGDYHDSNWLLIAVRVESRLIGNWRFYEPCLLTHEVLKLIEFLESASRNEVTLTTCGFFEPNIWFTLVNRINTLREVKEEANASTYSPAELGYNTLRVNFDAESRPRWIDREWALKNEIYCDFPINPGILMNAAVELRAGLAKFPPREGKI